ncbi:hypothetical protein B0H13DRAFT_1897541, partial [Mycena leptocephala]
SRLFLFKSYANLRVPDLLPTRLNSDSPLHVFERGTSPSARAGARVRYGIASIEGKESARIIIFGDSAVRAREDSKFAQLCPEVRGELGDGYRYLPRTNATRYARVWQISRVQCIPVVAPRLDDHLQYMNLSETHFVYLLAIKSMPIMTNPTPNPAQPNPNPNPNPKPTAASYSLLICFKTAVLHTPTSNPSSPCPFFLRI